MANSSPSASCVSCGASVTGKFCSECGAPARGAKCGACGSSLTPGARFCHGCGLAVGAASPSLLPQAARAPHASPQAAPQPGGSNYLPWTIAVLAFVAVVAILAGQRFGSPAASADQAAAPMAGGGGPASTVDIASMSPREQVDRLFDRVMRLASEGKKDSVSFFSPMALSLYEGLGPLDNDLRYDLGRVAEVSNNLDIAAAQADTILRENPRHLLGLVLAGRVAELKGNTTARGSLRKRLLDALSAEQALNREEYGRHKGDIDAAVTAARSGK